MDKRETSRGRKKSGTGKIKPKIATRDVEEDESMNGDDKQHLGSNVGVAVGDKIRVHYKRDTIYDAKVTKVQHDDGEKWPKYFVHYQGWNARYDEWIKRSRIAENLSWNKERLKRGFSLQNDAATESSTSEEPDQAKAKDTPAKSVKKEKVLTKQRGKPPGSKSVEPSNNSRSATPSSITSKESRTGSPLLKRQSSKTSTKNESDTDDDDEEEISEPRKSTRLQKTPTSEKKKAPAGRNRAQVSKTESNETDVEVEHDDVKEENVVVVLAARTAAETPTKETPTKAKRGRKVATKTEPEQEKPEPEAQKQPETPKQAEPVTPRVSARERTPTAKTPKGRKGRGGSLGRDEEEDPYAFKEPEPFEAKFETPRKSPASASKKSKASESGTKKLGRPAKNDSEESADSSSDEAGKKLVARGRSRQKLILSESVVDEVAEKVDVAPIVPLVTASATPPVSKTDDVKPEEKKSDAVAAAPVEDVAAPDEKVEIKTEPEPVVPVPALASVEDKKEVVKPSVPADGKSQALEVVAQTKEVVKAEEPEVEKPKPSERVVSEVSESQPDQGRPVLQLSKKQQELFPHLAAIRTTSIPFSRNTTGIPTTKMSSKNSPPQQQQQQPHEHASSNVSNF